MNFKNKLFLIFIVMVTACYLSCSKSKPTFEQYVKSLDTIPLPFYQKGDLMTYGLSLHFDTSGYKIFKVDGCFKPLGVYFKDNHNCIIVYFSKPIDDEYPILVCYDKLGHKLDSLNLCCDSTPTQNLKVKFYINNRIVMKDSSYHYIITSPKKDILKLTLDSTVYHLSKNGKFIKEIPNKL